MIPATIAFMGMATPKLQKIAFAYFWSVLLWVGFSGVMAGQDTVRMMGRGLPASYWHLLLANGAWCLTAAILTPPLFAIVQRFPLLTKPGGIARLVYYILGAIPFTIISSCLRWVLLPPWNATTQQFVQRSLQGLIGNAYLFANQMWDYFVIIAAAHAFEYFRRARNQELERAELQQALAASELQALKSQLHPHFLFNTLHGISTLIDSNRAQAKLMVLKLSGLLRTALQHSNSDLISLDEELKFIAAYLDLEKMRLEDRLDMQWDIQPETRQALVPQLILQPLVENAILHGIACCREGGWLKISSKNRDGSLELEILNSVGGKRQGGMGLGLENIRARLKHLYSGDASFSFEVKKEDIAVAKISLPAFGLHEHESRELSVIGRERQ